ncbi:nucleotidyltransferase family protein [Aliarcobacter vitoriensis]|nr:nucleotidyltransferase domain-containing protein [Aliarcobacter vitoriensis]
MDKDQVLNYLKNHKQYIFNTFGLNKIGLFGSFARNENKDSSDIDILFEVEKDKKFSMFQYLKLNKYLEDNLKIKVDLVREAAIKDDMKPYIRKDLIYV